jgi:hypothetical protein
MQHKGIADSLKGIVILFSLKHVELTHSELYDKVKLETKINWTPSPQ